MELVGYGWRQHVNHSKLLGDLESVGGLTFCPEPVLPKMVRWLMLAYIGEPGGYGMGVNRPVFYSDTAVPMVSRLFEKTSPNARKVIKDVAANSKTIKRSLSNKHIERRLEDLLDMTEEK